MRAIGYVVRRVVGLRWSDEHNQTIRNECRRSYYWLGLGPVVKIRICRGRAHDMRYFGSSHAEVIQFLQFVLSVGLILAAILKVADIITYTSLEDVSPVPRVGGVR